MRGELEHLLRPGSWRDGDPSEPEVPLPGGDVTEGVVRVGGTVRRPRQATSAAVAGYLRHLEGAGFDGAPRFLGTDTGGRDVLEHLPGEVAGQPPEAWIADESLLAPLGALVRRLHEASAAFRPMGGRPFYRDLMPDPPELAHLVDTPTIVGHNDVTPQNVVVRDGVPVALIDFDLAGPTTPLRDVANACLHWAPLGDPADATPALGGLDAFRRCRLVVDGYGLAAADRARFVDVLLRGAELGWHRMRAAAEQLGGGWQRMWDEGVGEVIRRRERWLRSQRDGLTAALLE